jgi:hypothetical protein
MVITSFMRWKIASRSSCDCAGHHRKEDFTTFSGFRLMPGGIGRSGATGARRSQRAGSPIAQVGREVEMMSSNERANKTLPMLRGMTAIDPSIPPSSARRGLRYAKPGGTQKRGEEQVNRLFCVSARVGRVGY